ncbi:retrovirus-related Pol polyprotein from transposon 297 [Trichonephila clavipes]|nr:retrovirus-related Pol polyprotein from transposon 297 [Trichonephila clavipes]
MISPELSDEQRNKLSELLRKFSGLFTKTDKSTAAKTNVKHRIFTGDHAPINQRAYRVSPTERRIIHEEVQKMLDEGIVQPSESPWSSPIVLVPCSFLPWISDLVIGKIEIDEADREKTAFITPEGLYEFKVMPFGLCNAPATFERMMDNLLRHFKWTMCLCYLDDIIVFSETFEDHLIRLRLVLKCLQEAGLKLNSKKCLFAAQEVKILGHLVSSNGVRPDPDKIKASLLKSGVEFHWGPEEVEAFNSLKKALTSDPVLGMYDERASTEIHTDASGYGIGAVLVQIQNNVEKVIAYASRTLTKAEKNYSTTERECLAIVWATNKFRPYIFGKHFTVVTDHHSLCWLMNLKDPSGRLARWALRLQEHDFDVKYKTGKKHSDADALSRNPVEEETETSDKFLAVTTSMNLAMEQKKDQDLAKLKLLSNSSKNEEFRFIDGILCRKNFDPDGKLWLPVIPKHLRADILRHFHDAPPQDTLVSRKLMTGYARDFTGRECTEMSFAEVDEIAKFLLEEIVLRHGAPRVIITDRGAVFRSRLVSSRRLV